ncbi:leukocyte receptor cluster member 1 homolog [Oncorhynchus clarkii lewisi]|uniref:leukocyte receptor cluster member 1 homolog n=1 Tax=Oncorhynchus clarkii lewisi TaxID=490388 RepID=UPI0039B9472A
MFVLTLVAYGQTLRISYVPWSKQTLDFRRKMNILPKKSWHVRNKDNVARVRRDEAQAAEEEREVQRRVERAEQEARTEHLRQKSRAALQQSGGWKDEGGEGSGGVVEHINLFPLEESSEKKGNAEYLKDQKDEKEREERAIGLLVSLGPQPGTEVTPWYMKTGQEEEKGEEKEKEKDNKGKRLPLSQEEKEKRDRRLKDMLDPLKEMKKALAVKDRKEQKSKKKEKRDRGERRSSGGESSIERLRAERLQREAEEKRRAQALLDQKNGTGKEKERPRETEEREMPYNSAYFPELARKRQRKDRNAWRDGIF